MNLPIQHLPTMGLVSYLLEETTHLPMGPST